MKKQELNKLSKLIRKVDNYKPKEVPKKPETAPSKKEIEKKYKLHLNKLEISE